MVIPINNTARFVSEVRLLLLDAVAAAVEVDPRAAAALVMDRLPTLVILV